ncbi:MAG: B12-binding domain-containing radical SAM protein [Lachnospiraceae bacterium]|nr:B12-binding domain-containing radical SAM protein [Lachnospiraceae bacterium]
MEKEILLVAINAKYIHSNLAVQSIRGVLEENGYKARVKEYTINNRVEDILDDIYMEKPVVIGFSCYIWNIEYIEKLVASLGKLLPTCKIFLGGPEVSYNTDYYLDKYSNVSGVMVGEGEETFLELAQKLFAEGIDESCQNNIGNIELAGLCTRDNRKPLLREPLDMSKLPFPYSNLKEFENRIIYYESSRGCPFSCSYCLSSIDKKLRFRDLELVKKELLFFLENKVEQVKFIDRTFNCLKERCEEIWQFIKENDNGYTNFHFEISADLITDKQIEILNNMRPGAVQLEIGVQTTNEDSIKAIRRKMDIEKLREVVARLRAPKNIHLHLDLIAGLPYEDIVSFRKSFNDVYNMKPDELQLGFLKLLYGSTMYDDAKEYGIVCKDFPPYEVLYTKWLSFDDVLSLKKTEEALEIYYGTGQFVNSINYLIDFYDTPYDFYKALGEFYASKSSNGEKHSRISRYNILLEFAHVIVCELKKDSLCDISVVKSLLTYDIYVRENIKTRPSFAVDATAYKEDIKIFARNNNIDKSCHIEVVERKVLSYINDANNKTLESDMVFVVFDYENRNPLNHNATVEIYEYNVGE